MGGIFFCIIKLFFDSAHDSFIFAFYCEIDVYRSLDDIKSFDAHALTAKNNRTPIGAEIPGRFLKGWTEDKI